MSDFEKNLAGALHEAAKMAPSLDVAKVRRRKPRRFGVVMAMPVAAGVVLAGSAAWLWVGGDQAGQRSDARCIAQISFDGRDYLRTGDITRVPKPGASLGRVATAPCEGFQQELEATAAAGFDATDVIMADGDLWLRTGSNPAGFGTLSTPVSCADDKSFELKGSPLGYEPSDVETIEFEALEGPEWLLGSYQAVRLTASLSTAKTPWLTRAIRSGAGLTVEMRCDGDAFEAVALARD